MLEKHGPDVYFNFSGQEGGVSRQVYNYVISDMHVINFCFQQMVQSQKISIPIPYKVIKILFFKFNFIKLQIQYTKEKTKQNNNLRLGVSKAKISN